MYRLEGYNISVAFIFNMAVAGTVIACSNKWTTMRYPVGASDSSSNLMDTQILIWPHSDICKGGQIILGYIDHKIALNLHFCNKYVCVVSRKR